MRSDAGKDKARMELRTSEEPATRSPAEARRWVAFYEDLLGYEEAVVQRMRELQEAARPPLKEAIQQSNIQPLEALMSDFRERLDFWRRRAAELGG